jgi:CO/xanthine dehydrogenase Mo-binding subunit
MQDDSPQVWEGVANASAPRVRETGTWITAFPECAAVIEGFYTTPVQIHNPMETHGNTVSWTDDGLTAWASTQGISSVRDGLAGALQLDQSQVRVITEYMGGGFGAKFGAGVEGVLAARLSREAKAPVRLMLTRFDQALAVGNRPSSFQKIKMGALPTARCTRLRWKITARRASVQVRMPAAAAAARIFPRPIFTSAEHAREAIRGRGQRRFLPRVSRAGSIRRLLRHGIRHGRPRREARHGSAGIPAQK